VKHRSKMIRALGAVGAAGMIAAVGLGFSSPGFAHDPTKVEKVIIITDHSDGGGAEHRGGGDAERHIRTFRMDGAGMMASCGGERDAVSESTDGGRERTRIVVCGNGNLSPTQRIEKLEHALTRINANEELSAEHKEKVTAALRAEIERLRGAP